MRAFTRIAATLKTTGFWLGTVQVLLAATFLFAGSFKAFAPMSMMQMPVALPEWFVRFLGYAEMTGAAGLILPSLLRIKPWLTPLAAACLLPIMIGATTLTLLYLGFAMAIMPIVLGSLSAFVAYGRVRLAPQQPRRSRRPVGLHAQAA